MVNRSTMGDPTPESGTYFMREWFQYADPPPRPHMRIYAASDYATKHGEGDYTTHVIVGVTPEDDIHILDVWRRQAESDTWIEVAVGMMERYEPIVWAEESGQIEKSVGSFLRKQMLERKVYCRRQQFPSAADKATRARSIQGRWAMRKVYFPRTRPDWLPELEAELLKFPLGANDDQVDALSLIGRMVAGLHPGKVPATSERMGILHYPPDGTIEQVDLNSDDARHHARPRMEARQASPCGAGRVGSVASTGFGKTGTRSGRGGGDARNTGFRRGWNPAPLTTTCTWLYVREHGAPPDCFEAMRRSCVLAYREFWDSRYSPSAGMFELH